MLVAFICSAPHRELGDVSLVTPQHPPTSGRRDPAVSPRTRSPRLGATSKEIDCTWGTRRRNPTVRCPRGGVWGGRPPWLARPEALAGATCCVRPARVRPSWAAADDRSK